MQPQKAREAHLICNLEEAQGVLTYKSAAMNWSGLHDRKIRTERTLLFSVRSDRILFAMLYDTLHTSLICMPFLGYSQTAYLHVLSELLTYSICSANMRQKLISSRMQDPQITGTP